MRKWIEELEHEKEGVERHLGEVNTEIFIKTSPFIALPIMKLYCKGTWMIL